MARMRTAFILGFLVLSTVLGFLVFNTGFNGLFGGGNGQTPATTAEQVTSQAATNNQTRSQTPVQPLFTTDTNTNEIILRVSDLSAPYNFGDEEIQSVTELEGTRRTEYRTKGILKRHERTFTLDMENGSINDPVLVILRVTIYESTEASQESIKNKTNQYEQEGASVTTILLC